MSLSTKRVVVIGSIPSRHINRLRASTVVHELPGDRLDTERSRQVLSEAHGLVVTGQPAIDAPFLDAAPDLEVISLRAVGYDKVDIDECARRGVTVCNTPGVLDDAVAELTVLLMLAVARRLPHVALQGTPSAPVPALGQDLKGRTLGIVGYGRIGRRLAEIASAGLGMHVLYAARSEKPSALGEHVGLDALLRGSDVVSLHVPLTPETTGLISSRELALMRPGAILVNASRGGLVDETALLRALEEGRLGGAGLDVTAREPLPSDDPLRSAPNLVLTPHIGSATEQTRDAMADLAVNNLLLALEGREPLAWVTLGSTHRDGSAGRGRSGIVRRRSAG